MSNNKSKLEIYAIKFAESRGFESEQERLLCVADMMRGARFLLKYLEKEEETCSPDEYEGVLYLLGLARELCNGK